MIKRYYIYDATLVRVIDGDTVELSVDLGFSISQVIRVRMAGYNAPEIRTTDQVEKAAGHDATMKFESLLSSGRLVLQTIKDSKEKYGRYLANIFVPELGLDVGKTMLDYLNHKGHIQEMP